MSFIDKYYAIFNNSVGQHSVTINRAEFANLLGVFCKQEQQLGQLKVENADLKNGYSKLNSLYKDNCDYTGKLERILTEIKEIAEKSYKTPLEEKDCIICDDFLGQILQKISEVEMTDKQIRIDGADVSNCKYYIEDNGVKYQDLYQYTDMCYKLPYNYCENKRFCWYKIITKIKRIFRYGK